MLLAVFGLLASPHVFRIQPTLQIGLLLLQVLRSPPYYPQLLVRHTSHLVDTESTANEEAQFSGTESREIAQNNP